MILFTSLTSPYSCLVRVAIAEKGLASRVEERVIDPWGGDSEFLRANVHERVPALITDSGHGIAESGLILAYLDRLAPDPPLFPAEGLPAVLQRASSALGAIDVMAAIIIRRQSNAEFDTHVMGQRRFRTLAAALDRLEADPPADLADIAAIATAVALDYAAFRFPDRDWLADRPRLTCSWWPGCRRRAWGPRSVAVREARAARWPEAGRRRPCSA